MNTDLIKLEAILRDRFCGVEVLGLTEDGVLSVKMAGQCASCPVQCLTLEQDILEAVENDFPQVKGVAVSPDVSEDTMNMVRSILRRSP